MDTTFLVLGVLAVWRVTHLLHAESGPTQVFERLRKAAGSGVIGQTLGCFHCLSLWVSVPVALLLGSQWAEFVFVWLGLSAAAILLERVTAKAEVAPTPVYVEDALDSDYPPIQTMDAGPQTSFTR